VEIAKDVARKLYESYIDRGGRDHHLNWWRQKPGIPDMRRLSRAGPGSGCAVPRAAQPAAVDREAVRYPHPVFASAPDAASWKAMIRE
jgi:hypothetical protein